MGEAILDKMIGMWAFAIYDEQTKNYLPHETEWGLSHFIIIMKWRFYFCL
jgi:hypothetical protein